MARITSKATPVTEVPIRSDPDEVNRTCDEDKINWGGVSDCFSVNVIRSPSRLCSSRKGAGTFCTPNRRGRSHLRQRPS